MNKNWVKALNALLEFKKWKICSKHGKVACNTNNGIPISFIHNINRIDRYFDGVKSLRTSIYLANAIAYGNKLMLNPWHKMSDEEILIKCELEHMT